MDENKLGTLYGISVGTGDPELMTIKAVKTLQKCPVVTFPAGIQGKKGVAETIIQGYLQPTQIILPLNFPYTQNENQLQRAWNLASLQVWQFLQEGKDVAFACEGDVSFYSTFTYLAQNLRDKQPLIEIKSIAGVSSPMVAANALQIPLTTQDDKFVVLPALYSVSELEKVLDWADTIVLLKVASVYLEVWKILHRRNLWEKAWIVEKVSLAEEKIYYPLNKYPNLSLSYFSLLIIKKCDYKNQI